jgi:threonylcarbamoyladenosine tRNA methylthiotransferase MtaB
MPTVSFATLGCRVNQVDTLEIQAALEARGFRAVPFDEPADVVVVNSCTVTARADFSDRQMVRRAGRVNPRSRIVVTGCWAQVAPAAAALPGVDLVVGTAEKARLPDLLQEVLATPKSRPAVHVGDLRAVRTLDAAPLARTGARSRAFVKAQDGCQHRCAFCIVPVARGASRSVPPDALVAQVHSQVEVGHPEVVLTGVDLGHYGADLVPRTTLAATLGRIVEIPGLRWLRLSSLLPAYFTDDLVDLLVTAPVVAPHFHVPLQSGSDRVLRRMRRPYTVAMYRRLIERLAGAIPSLGLGADVIVGFPGEADADFEATFALVGELPFSYLHVFAYSDRAGTEAARLDGRVDRRIIGERSDRLRALAGAKSLAFRRRLVGGDHDVLVLDTRERGHGRLVGLTGNYVEVAFDGPDALMRSMTRVRVTAVEGEQVMGELA